MFTFLEGLRATPKTVLRSSFRGAFWMSAGAAFFAIMINLVRYLTDHFDPLQVVFFRNIFGLLAVLPWISRQGWAALQTKRLHLHVVRAMFGIAAMVLWFTTLSLMPLAEATALSFTAPIFTSILAVAFLREVMYRHRWLAIGMSLLGALLVLRPGIAALNPVAVLAIFTAFVWGSSTALLKYMSRTETTSAIVIYLPLFLTPISLVPAVIVWEWPSPMLWGVAILFGVVGTAGHFCLTRALTVADATSIMPFDYLRLPFVALLAYVAFGEVADIWVWFGGGLIAGSAIYIARREARMKGENGSSHRLHLHVVRAMFGIAAMVLWFTTLSLMPLAEATALSFTAPIFTSILAVAFLREVMYRHRWLAIGMSLLGALLVLRPGIAALNPVAVLAIFTAFVWGSSTALLKYMSRTETTSAIVIYLPLFLTPISLVPAVIVWEWPSPMLWGVAILFGVVGTAGHFCLTRALTVADATSIMPFDYLRLPFVALLAYVAFGEVADIWVWFGGGLIAGSAIYIARREARMKGENGSSMAASSDDSDEGTT